MIKNISLVFILAFAVSGCASTGTGSESSIMQSINSSKIVQMISSSEKVQNCDYEKTEGREFVFQKLPFSLRAATYIGWRRLPKHDSGRIEYDNYLNKKGKFQEPLKVRKTTWYPAILETCETVYTEAGTADSLDDLPVTLLNIYFVDDFKEAQSMVGGKLKYRKITDAPNLYTDDPKTTYSLKDNELLSVTGVETFKLGHASTDGSFYLIVKKESGESGYLPYGQMCFAEVVKIKTDVTGHEASIPKNTEAGQQYVVRVAVLNIRAEPTTESRIVGKVKKGDILTSERSEGNSEGQWFRVHKGFVYASYMLAIDSSEAQNILKSKNRKSD